MTAKQKTAKGSMPATRNSRMALSGRSTDTGLEIYRYDAFNRLTNYNSGSIEASYTYNANNLRASKTVNGEKNDFVWNGQNLAAENKADITNTYTYDMTGVHMANQNGTATTYLKDYHGNVIGKITKGGERVTTTDYDAFGNQWQGDVPDPFGYCGEYLDSESGLVYLRNRYYDTTSGRFITEDPVKDGLNWYSYCGNNPINCIDPFGLSEVMIRYIIEKNGGSVSWNSKTKEVTANLNGKTVIYSGERNINGRVLIDSEQIANDFDLSSDEVDHKEGDSFYSRDDAAMAFGLVYNIKSAERTQDYPNGNEYGALLYDDSIGDTVSFTFGNVVKGTDNFTHLDDPDIDRNWVGWVHTHGAYPGPNYLSTEFFSGSFDYIDEDGKTKKAGDGQYAVNSHKDGYVITPQGAFKCLSSTWAIVPSGYIEDEDPAVRVIATGLPHGRLN